jgi:hypothetical protein
MIMILSIFIPIYLGSRFLYNRKIKNMSKEKVVKESFWEKGLMHFLLGQIIKFLEQGFILILMGFFLQF